MKITQELYLASLWHKLHKEYNASTDWQEFMALRRMYRSPGRHYHTWQHVYDCVKFTEQNFGWQPTVLFALFYHDCVYDVMNKDNESQSALLWMTYAKRRPLANRITYLARKQVNDLIILTAGHKLPAEPSLQMEMMIDADFQVFLKPTEVYMEYARGVWLEYSAVGREAYTTGRLAFLATVNPSKIFRTHQTQRLIGIAKANIQFEKDVLSSDTLAEAFFTKG
jgi:predicted metal-dependent HD superfamily phosphohydrolase